MFGVKPVTCQKTVDRMIPCSKSLTGAVGRPTTTTLRDAADAVLSALETMWGHIVVAYKKQGETCHIKLQDVDMYVNQHSINTS